MLRVLLAGKIKMIGKLLNDVHCKSTKTHKTKESEGLLTIPLNSEL